ncbi:hypothetical protein D0T12_10185 [Actinomadura spongiicola]|uniref:DUF485 domain-containing protein n=1 Tax=Actinomadura spongiicola TaxID=2303421 RepID=A0A372GJ59_9ACTN|nr:hypothetical protein [Actinomadura spongiicola]RFS85398.1 hypothetical protein D0T12_10185 [Actinomadura spongiicola]
MNGERRTVVTGRGRARTPPDAAQPPGARPADDQGGAPEPPGTETQDPDPLHTDPNCSGECGWAAPHGYLHGDLHDEAPRPDEASALIRAQLRIALGTLAIVLAVVAGLPALLALVPAVARARLGGVPLSWLVLLLGVQPVWVAVSLRQLRRAERAERDLTRPVDGP